MSNDTAQHNGPLVLIIRDGWGENPDPDQDQTNAVKLAQTPADSRLRDDWPHVLIHTSGEDVGLPEGVMGNSEVGHQNIGAGRVVDQEVMRITRSIHDGSFFRNDALLKAFEHARSTGGRVHLFGLASDGKVHSDLSHLEALIDMAVEQRFPGDHVLIHAITDGRDTGPRTGKGFIERIERKVKATNTGRIATVIGRYYAMDRDHRWDRTQRAFVALTGRGGTPDEPEGHAGAAGAGTIIGGVQEGNVSPATGLAPAPGNPLQQKQSARPVAGDGQQQAFTVNRAGTPLDAVTSYYDHPTESSRQGDEFILPTRIAPDGETFHDVIDDGDAVIFFNFRGDRPRQITRAFVLDQNAWSDVPGGGFDRGKPFENLYFCTMTAYEAGLPVDAVAFPKPPKMHDTLGEVISRAGLTQFRCAETEKFAHVTFFFNDYREEPWEGEHRLLCPSPQDVSTYDQKPEMSAHDVCDGVLGRLSSDDCETLLVVNFANPDMVGHTGSIEATVRAVETVDACVEKIVDRTLEVGGTLLITADHGNAEQMWDAANDAPHTAHTPFDVMLFLVGERFLGRTLRAGGRLADIAPTVLEILGLSKPEAMTGRSLLS